jgi:hypothetical protein
MYIRNVDNTIHIHSAQKRKDKINSNIERT